MTQEGVIKIQIQNLIKGVKVNHIQEIMLGLDKKDPIMIDQEKNLLTSTQLNVQDVKKP